MKPKTARRERSIQYSLPGLSAVEAAVKEVAEAGVEARGAVFTKQEVVDFILDLIGYTADQPLHKRKLLEPSFGHGDFLLVAVRRLLQAYRKNNRSKSVSAVDLVDCIRGVELHSQSFFATRDQVAKLLEK